MPLHPPDDPFASPRDATDYEAAQSGEAQRREIEATAWFNARMEELDRRLQRGELTAAQHADAVWKACDEAHDRLDGMG
jgi:hypothetical protein